MLFRSRLEEDRPVIANIASQQHPQELLEENVVLQACAESCPRRSELMECTKGCSYLAPDLQAFDRNVLHEVLNVFHTHSNPVFCILEQKSRFLHERVDHDIK